jgi:hypothetical protein
LQDRKGAKRGAVQSAEPVQDEVSETNNPPTRSEPTDSRDPTRTHTSDVGNRTQETPDKASEGKKNPGIDGGEDPSQEEAY